MIWNDEKDSDAQCRLESLWQGADWNAMPQRHRIAESAAVVEKGRKDKAAQKACRKDAAMKAMPQRH